MVSAKTTERQTQNNDQPHAGGKANFASPFHTAPSHLSKQVSERKIEGHELETVLLTNFLIVSKNIRILSITIPTSQSLQDFQRLSEISDNCFRCIRLIS